MSKELLYPAGYRLTIHSWENDVDNTKTNIVAGLTERQAQIMVSIAKLFKYRHNSVAGIGNMYEPNDEEMIESGHKLLETLSLQGCLINKDDELYEVEPWLCFEELFSKETGHEFYELGLTSDEFFTRVAESIDVSLLEEPIYVVSANEKFGLKQAK
jgi:hypothetical protein